MTKEETLEPFVSIAPGRLCVFGEHQDYLHLPVIALALPLACKIRVTPKSSSRDLVLHFGTATWSIDLDDIPPPPNQQQQPRDENSLDFALAAVHEVLSDGWEIACGADCISTTTIPLQAGCSSSSAFCVAWIQVLATLSHKILSPIEAAQWAHRAEVLHFGSPGGTMDHVTSAIGGILRIGPGMWDYQSLEDIGVVKGEGTAGVWVLAYSGEPKDTLKHLNRCKQDRLKLLEKLGGSWDHDKVGDSLSQDEQDLLNATIVNRDMEEKAATEWTTSSSEVLASYMVRHHEALRDGLLLSTERLEAMNQAAVRAGAWGFKVVGSGGGGCGVAWCPSCVAEAVSEAMKNVGAPQTWIISGSSPGASIHYEK